MNNKSKPCYCGSRQPFSQCCEPLLTNTQTAKTAEQLMRSRFSAFCCKQIDYLLETLHPSQHSNNDKQYLTSTIESCHWLALKIKQTHMGQAKHQTGEVEFIATFQQDEKLGQLHERSSFVKEQDRWFYMNGNIIPTTDTIVMNLGRNDTCWCGSGKKYKKCHG